MKKNEILLSATWVELESILLSKKSQIEKKQMSWFHLYVEYKKWIGRTETDSENTDSCQVGGGCGDGWEGEGVRKYQISSYRIVMGM